MSRESSKKRANLQSRQTDRSTGDSLLLMFYVLIHPFPEGGEVTFRCTILYYFTDSEHMSVYLSLHEPCLLLLFPFGL